MEHANDFNGVVGVSVEDDIGRSSNNPLAGAGDTPGFADVGMIQKTTGGFGYAFDNLLGSGEIILSNVGERVIDLAQRSTCPLQFQA